MLSRSSLVAGLLSVVILCSSIKTISAEMTTEVAYLANGFEVFLYWLDKVMPGTQCLLGGPKDLWPILKKIECTDDFECKLNNLNQFEFRELIRSIISRCGEVVGSKSVSKPSSKTLTIAYYIGLAADKAQYYLEKNNFIVTGKVVGAFGSIVSGALFGSTGGIIGIFMGGVIGFGTWATSEILMAAQHDVEEYKSLSSLSKSNP